MNEIALANHEEGRQHSAGLRNGDLPRQRHRNATGFSLNPIAH